jgi:hypothetical protein
MTPKTIEVIPKKVVSNTMEISFATIVNGPLLMEAAHKLTLKFKEAKELRKVAASKKQARKNNAMAKSVRFRRDRIFSSLFCTQYKLSNLN